MPSSPVQNQTQEIKRVSKCKRLNYTAIPFLLHTMQSELAAANTILTLQIIDSETSTLGNVTTSARRKANLVGALPQHRIQRTDLIIETECISICFATVITH